MTRVGVVATIILLPLLAGCFDGPDHPRGATVDGPIRIALPADMTQCDRSVFSNCAEILADPAAPAHVGGFDVKMDIKRGGSSDGFAGNGLIIDDLHRDLIIEDMHFTGDGVGIKISDREDPCDTCTITVRRVTMDQVRGGLHLAEGDAAIVMRDVSINLRTGGPDGAPTATAGPDGWNFDTDQLDAIRLGWMWDDRIRFDAERVNLTSEPPSTGAAIHINHDGYDGVIDPLRFQSIQVSGFGTGIHYMGEYEAHIDDITIDCGEHGIDAWPNVRDGYNVRADEMTFTATHLDITGCSGSAVTTRAGGVDLESIQLTDNYRGLHIEGGNDVRLNHFEFIDHGYGLIMAADSHARHATHITNGHVEGNLYVGLQTKSDAVLVDQVAFLFNGLDWPDPKRRDFQDQPVTDPNEYAALWMRYSTTDPESGGQMVVRNSTFDGNEPYGLFSTEFRGGTDAILNCWGDPTGPGVRSSVANQDVAGPGLGDKVNEFVRYTPFVPCMNRVSS